MEIKNKLVINEITVFVSVDKDGNEGLVAQMIGNTWLPFVCADEDRIKQLLPIALEMEKKSGIPIRILKFTSREDVSAKYKMNLHNSKK